MRKLINKPLFKPTFKTESEVSKHLIEKDPTKYGLTLSQIRYFK
jgi:hypothetical protein